MCKTCSYYVFLAHSVTFVPIVLSMFMLSLMFVIVCGQFELKRIYACFISFVYICWRFSYQEESVGIPLIGLTPAQLCACPKTEPGFPASYVVVPTYLCSV